jgi:hypothetical protein
MSEEEKVPTPVLKPLKENKALFVFERLERNAPDKRTTLAAVKEEASQNKVYNNGHLPKEE